jgi:hypothetical protein
MRLSPNRGGVYLSWWTHAFSEAGFWRGAHNYALPQGVLCARELLSSTHRRRPAFGNHTRHNCPMSTTLFQKAGYILLLLLLVGMWACALILLVNFFLYLNSLVKLMFEIAQLG